MTTVLACNPVSPATDRLDALWTLAARRAEGGNPEYQLRFALMRLGPAFRAADQGHAVIWDPPVAPTSVCIRWICIHCGHVVVARSWRPDTAYGTALTLPCTANGKDTP